MGFFDRLFKKEDNKERESSRDVIDAMLSVAEEAMDKGDYKSAAETYRNVLKLEQDNTACYNLGSLYARGLGVSQSFMEGAYWFNQAGIRGDEQAQKLCLKCELDHVMQDIDKNSPEQLYTDVLHFVKYVYPDSKDENLETCRKLYAAAGNCLNKEKYAEAAKLLRAAAEYGNDGYSQNYLAVLFNTGSGVEQNDLAALYWFDKAVDNGAADVALTDRDGILDAYKQSCGPSEFYELMLELSGWCRLGCQAVPKDAIKAEYWRKIGEKRVREAGSAGGS